MNENNLDIVLNSQNQRSINLKEIPTFLGAFDNRNRACHYHPNMPSHSHDKHDYMLFISGDYGQIAVYSLPNFMTNIEPSIVDTCELFPTNLCLSLESFTVYEYNIVVQVRRFEQWSNEIEHSKLFKAGLPMMKSEQVYVF